METDNFLQEKIQNLEFKHEGLKSQVKDTFGKLTNKIKNISSQASSPDKDKENVKKVIDSLRSELVTSLILVYWTTKENDDRDAELLNETLKNI